MADVDYRRYQELQRYVGWDEADGERVRALRPFVEASFAPLVDDFYATIEQHPDTWRAITGGREQIERLKDSLHGWIDDLFSGRYDEAYVTRRWRVGCHHAAIGLEQIWATVALSRLRWGLIAALERSWTGGARELSAAIRSFGKLIDLDLALIEDAYRGARAARERLATFGVLVEQVPCMIVILGPDHTIRFFSAHAEQLTGWRAEEVVGRDYFPIFLPESHHVAVTAEIRKVMAGNRTQGYENPVLMRDGLSRLMVWNAVRLADWEGSPAVLAVGQDITRIKDAQEVALRAERLATIGQMLATLTHESRNNLQAVRFTLDVLEPRLAAGSDEAGMVARIRQAVDEVRHLYEDVRGYAAPVVLERRRQRLSDILAETWDSLEAERRGRSIALEIEGRDQERALNVDRLRLGQIFRNILENSFAACEDPVEIEVVFSLATLRKREAQRIAVRDNGPGLGPEPRKRIFEPFYTSKPRGTGLGMAIVQRLVEAHDGRVTVGSSERPGAEIVLTFPV